MTRYRMNIIILYFPDPPVTESTQVVYQGLFFKQFYTIKVFLTQPLSLEGGRNATP